MIGERTGRLAAQQCLTEPARAGRRVDRSWIVGAVLEADEGFGFGFHVDGRWPYGLVSHTLRRLRCLGRFVSRLGNNDVADGFQMVRVELSQLRGSRYFKSFETSWISACTD